MCLRASLPDAKWSDHHGFMLAEFQGETYLVSDLSRWAEAREVNAKWPFPKGVIPILLADCPMSDVVPRTKYFLGGLGFRLMSGQTPIGPIRVPEHHETCSEPGCIPCQFHTFGVDAANL